MFAKTVERSFRALCESINTPLSLECRRLFLSGDHLTLAKLEFTPSDYEGAELNTVRNDYLVTEYLSKYTGLVTGVDTAAAAYDSFIAAETRCRQTNVKLRNLDFSRFPDTLRLAITRAQRLIEGCIGASPDFEKISCSAKWGKGSTFSLSGESVRIDAKLREEQQSITQQAVYLHRYATGQDYALLRARGIEAEGPTTMLSGEYNIVHGCRGVTVPKNAKTDRFIAIEPSGNVFIQLGFGSVLRQCLRRIGIDLNDQGTNQTLARIAYAEGLATVDLKAASDTICRELIWLLLPFRWAYALDSARSHMIQINDRWIPLEKFSSMGNGFTFELESLIFWALTRSVCDVIGNNGRVNVYGDDIICPASATPSLFEVLDFCGFTVNTKKTHVSGSFRESCGKHYWQGFDITPVYQKEKILHVEAFYRHHNRLLYHAIDRGVVDSKLKLAFGDKTLREAVRLAAENTLKNCHTIPILWDSEARSLDGGLCTTAARVKAKFVGNEYRCTAWVFTPLQKPAFEDAVLAVHYRTRSAPRRTFNHYPNISGRFHSFRAERDRWHAIRRAFAVSVEHELEVHKAIGTDLALPFNGKVTIRGQGRWAHKTARYPHMCDLHWVGCADVGNP